ncbi:DUF7532 family protein [Halomicrobium urmianum]|uniref:DUF7532 family protein n=1 Tax=Halomicrobium urmianum TaxID=1586233 RepID=UPI001CD9AA0E|nr:hypothetical protein [Halomicrobium urmianum]
MHFSSREQAALREAGLSTDEIRAASDAVADATEAAAEELEDFFDGRDVVYSDMDRAHSSSDVQEHAVEYLDLFTHADDVRGYLRFDAWGVYVEGGRVLSEGVVELTLGPTVHDRVRFAADRADL